MLRTAAVAGVVFGLSACESGKLQTRPKQPDPVRVSQAVTTHLEHIEKLKDAQRNRFVAIHANDIQLPLTAGHLEAQDHRVYSFYVWAFDPQDTTLSAHQLFQLGRLRVDVLGASARIRAVDYRDSAGVSALQTPASNVLAVDVNSRDITSSFTLLAWLPERYFAGHDSSDSSENPFAARREIRVYNGDLRSRIYVAGEDEVRASFGPKFADYFYVGRVYLRNNHADKRLIVYTTSLRANVLLYRPPMDPPAAEPVETDPRSVVRTPRRQPSVEDRRQAQDEQLRKKIEAFRQAAAASREPRPARFAEHLTLRQREEIVQQELTRPLDGPAYVPNINDATSVASWEMRKAIRTRLGRELEGITHARATALSAGYRNARALREELDRLARRTLEPPESGRRNELIANASPLVTSLLADPPNAKGAEDLAKLHHLFRTAVVPQTADALGLLNQLTKHYHDILLAEALQTALRQGESAGRARAAAVAETAERFPGDYEQRLAHIRNELLTSALSPLAERQDIAVNPDGKPLAYSEQLDRQLALSSSGYAWRDTYRPLTFQSILNSLIYSTNNSGRARFVRFLETAGIVAGGLAGAPKIFTDASKESYTQGVALFGTVLMPEVRKQLLDDLEKYIRNLGELAFDTVIVIPPNGVVDKYIFFPKGEIPFGRDEFSPGASSFIVQIDNSDVSVECLLVDESQAVSAGELSAQSLVARALDEGRAESDPGIRKAAEIQSRLMRFRMDSMIAEIEELFAKAGDNETEKIAAQRRALLLIAEFEKTFGEDKSGVVGRLRAKHKINPTNSPPSIGSIERISLVPGVTSTPIPVKISDDTTPPHDVRLTIASDNEERLPASLAVISHSSKEFANENTHEITLTTAAGDVGANRTCTITLTAQDYDDGKRTRTFQVDLLPATLRLPGGTELEFPRNETPSTRGSAGQSFITVEVPALHLPDGTAQISARRVSGNAGISIRPPSTPELPLKKKQAESFTLRIDYSRALEAKNFTAAEFEIRVVLPGGTPLLARLKTSFTSEATAATPAPAGKTN